MTAVLALVSALVIGGSDFGGGLATRHDNTFRVTAIAQIFGGVTAIVLALAVGADEVVRGDVIGGLVAGVSGTFSFICFYRALSIGVMSVVAPTTAVVGATIPAVVGVARGEDLSPATGLGIGVAIVLVARTGPIGAGAGDRSPRMALLLAVTAGVGFSAFFIALAETETAAGMWPLVIARFVSVPVVCAIAWRMAGRVWPVDSRSRRLAVATGVSEMIANAILVVALRRGPVAVAAVFGSLYPVSTVVLAWIVLRERITRLQMAGVGLAIGALVLVAR